MSNNDETKSKIYSQGYEKWEGDRTHAEPAWFLSAKAVLRNVLTPNGCLSRFIFIICFILPIGVTYIMNTLFSIVFFQMENLKDNEYLGLIVELLKQGDVSIVELHKAWVLYPSAVFCPILMFFYGSQMISKDKAANALQVYFSKAITRSEYVFSRFLAVGALTGLLTLIPTGIILGVGLLLNTDFPAFIKEAWYMPLAGVIYWLVLTLVYGSITLCFSSFFNKGYMAAVGVIGFLGFMSIFSQLMGLITGATLFLDGLMVWQSVYTIGEGLFSLTVESQVAIIWRVIDLVVICGVGIYFIFRNIDPVEVIK